MDLQLVVFIKVVEKKNFSKAAEELHMTQPAVSQYIQTLEEKVGTRLLERSNKFVRLTKAGEIVYHHAMEIIELYERTQSLVDDLMHTASGELSIGASYTFGEYILPHTIAYMRKQYPAINPTITIGNTKEISQLVSSNLLDVGIVEGDFKQGKLKTHSFSEDLMFVIASSMHRLSKQGVISVEDLKNETWIIREPGSGTREYTERLFSKLGFQPKYHMEFGSNQIIKESVEAGLGLSFISHWAVRKELSIGTLNTLKIDGAPISRKFTSIVQDTPFQTRALTIFLEVLHSNEGLPRV
jgi:LysR family transcriptional regulator, transcriptional activator of the cysJI operon